MQIHHSRLVLIAVAVFLVCSVAVGVGGAAESSVEAPDYQTASDLEEMLVLQFTVTDDGSARAVFQLNYADRDDNYDKSEFPYQSDEQAYNTFENDAIQTMKELAAASSQASGREMSVTFEDTNHHNSDETTIYRFVFEWTNFAEVREDGSMVVTEPFASDHPLFATDNRRAFLEAYPYWSPTASEFYVSDVTEAHTEQLSAHDYPYIVDFKSYDSHYEGFRAVLSPMPKETETETSRPTVTMTATATSTPIQTETSTPNADPEPGLPLPWILFAILVVVLSVAGALYRRK